MHIDRCMGIEGKEMGKPTAVVVMSVREDGIVHFLQVNVQTGGIADKSVALSHVKKNLVPIVHSDMKAQPMLNGKFFSPRVLHQNSYTHTL